jgi:hypothetical protein
MPPRQQNDLLRILRAEAATEEGRNGDGEETKLEKLPVFGNQYYICK